MQNRNILFSFVVLAILTSWHCNQGDSDVSTIDGNGLPPIVHSALETKLAVYRKSIMQKCFDEAIQDASTYVDSLVAEELRIHAGDTLYFPSKPIRPNSPEKIILDDSTVIAPKYGR